MKLGLTENIGRNVYAFRQFDESSAMDSSSFFVSSIVLVAGCLVTVINTAGWPFSEARPNRGVFSAGADFRYVAYGDRLAVDRFNDRAGHFLRLVGGYHAPHDVFVAPLVEYAAG